MMCNYYLELLWGRYCSRRANAAQLRSGQARSDPTISSRVTSAQTTPGQTNRAKKQTRRCGASRLNVRRKHVSLSSCGRLAGRHSSSIALITQMHTQKTAGEASWQLPGTSFECAVRPAYPVNSPACTCTRDASSRAKHARK